MWEGRNRAEIEHLSISIHPIVSDGVVDISIRAGGYAVHGAIHSMEGEGVIFLKKLQGLWYGSLAGGGTQ